MIISALAKKLKEITTAAILQADLFVLYDDLRRGGVDPRIPAETHETRFDVYDEGYGVKFFPLFRNRRLTSNDQRGLSDLVAREILIFPGVVAPFNGGGGD